MKIWTTRYGSNTALIWKRKFSVYDVAKIFDIDKMLEFVKTASTLHI
ncbi:hypothetical protein FM107_13715 [Sphingobacterium sp. JB170]|nr:hypothetical protein FM107_13715 [Sphingobacterium sp. JB170]